MRTAVIAMAVLAIATPALAGRALLDDRAKAEEGLWFDAAEGVYQPAEQNIFFSGISPENTLHTSQGDLKMDEAFPVGKFKPDQYGDALITGTNPKTGEEVKAIVRIALPVYNTDKKVLGVKAKTLDKEEPTILVGGKVNEAQADPATRTLDEEKESKLTNVKVYIDSKAAETPDQPEQPATPASNGGRRLAHYHYDPWGHPGGAIVGGAIGNAVCHGSIICTAAGAHYGYHHGR